MPRKVGARICEVLTVAESLGQGSVEQVSKKMPKDVTLDNCRRYCYRAVGLRLMTVSREQKPMVFSPVEGWREKLAERQARVSLAKPKAAAPRKAARIINSVFALGAV